MREPAEQVAFRAVLVLEWLLAESSQIILPTPLDFNLETRILHSCKAALGAADALHFAVAQHHNADQFFTLDAKLIKTARPAGVPAASEI